MKALTIIYAWYFGQRDVGGVHTQAERALCLDWPRSRAPFARLSREDDDRDYRAMRYWQGLRAKQIGPIPSALALVP